MTTIDDALRALLVPIIREAVFDAYEKVARAEPPAPALLTNEQVCQALQISRATLHRLRQEGLPVVMLLDSPRYHLADVLAWVHSRQP